MSPIRVAVYGALGKMGREVVNAVSHEADMQLVGAADSNATEPTLTASNCATTVPLTRDIESLLKVCQPDALVDFSVAAAVMPMVRAAAAHKINTVIGTTGMTQANIDEISQLAVSNDIAIMVAPNFTLGAVLMIHLAKVAAKYFDDAEIIELHHPQKADAPSGTSISTAKAMVQSRGRPFHMLKEERKAARGEQIGGISMHSVRLPGYLAHQEVIFGGAGQTLHIRHDSINRECYMPGVLLAVREVVKRKGLIYGLDTLLGL